MAEPEVRVEGDSPSGKTAAQRLIAEDKDFSTPWRNRLRSRSPLLDFRGRSTRIVFQESPNVVSVHGDAQRLDAADPAETRPAAPETAKMIQEPHVGGGWMDAFLKQLPEATAAAVLTSSCLLLLPLIIILRRSS